MSSFDREAEQEVDFGRYVRLLGARWWLVAAGLVVGAVVGYAISLGGSQQFKATATLYLGQPYSASGNVQLQSAQTNPSTVKTVVHSDSAIQRAEQACKIKGSIKAKWAKLTDDDLSRAEGNHQYLVGKLQERYGYAKDEAVRERGQASRVPPRLLRRLGHVPPSRLAGVSGHLPSLHGTSADARGRKLHRGRRQLLGAAELEGAAAEPRLPPVAAGAEGVVADAFALDRSDRRRHTGLRRQRQ